MTYQTVAERLEQAMRAEQNQPRKPSTKQKRNPYESTAKQDRAKMLHSLELGIGLTVAVLATLVF